MLSGVPINSERMGAFTNFMFRVSNTNAVRRFDLLAGDIYLGVRRIMFFNGSTSTENLLAKFHDGVNFTSSTPVIGAAGPENVLEFEGGTQTFSGGLSFTGADTSKHVTLRIADNATTYARAPYVTLTNGAVLTIWNFIVGSGGMTKDIRPEFTADASTLSINQLYPNAFLITAATNVFKFVNGSSLFQSAAMNIQGSVRFLFDHSGFYGNNSNQVRTVNIGVGSFGETSGFIADFTFSNGSRFNCDSLSYTDAASSTKAPFILTFDDSEWYAGAGTVTLPTTNLNVSVKTVAGGIVFAPPAGALWKFVSPISGAGGLASIKQSDFRFLRRKVEPFPY